MLAAPFHQIWSDGKSICVRRSSPLQASRAGCQVGPWDLGTSGVHLPLLWTILRHSPPRCEGISPGPMSRETGHMISCCFGHAQLASILIYRIPIFPQHSEKLGIILSAWFSEELDVTLVAFRSSGSLALSERWMIVRMDEFSIGINQSKNNSSNIDNSINSCFQISHDSYMPQLQKEQYWIVTHIFCTEVRRKWWIYHTCFKIRQFRLILYLVITTKMTSGSF